ncbi:MAG TPA: hypothetical protein VF740_04475 [Candidatus Acidoferrum sp.]
MTQNIRYTREQILGEWELAKRRLLPAKLKNTNANAHFLVTEMKNRGLAPTADNYFNVIQQMLFEGKWEWEIEPETLAAQRQNAGPARLTSAQSQEQGEAEAKTAEAAEARAKREAEFESATMEIINNFTPRNRQSQIDYAKRSEIQGHLRQYVEEQKARGASMESVKPIVEDYLRKLQEAIQRTMTLIGR